MSADQDDSTSRGDDSHAGAPIQPLLPYDEHNRRLECQVHPQQWQNPDAKQPYHLVVIGAGTAGLVTAAGAAGLGARVALIERELMGGDCLNVGCVPSKSLISAARAAASIRDAAHFGIGEQAQPVVDFAATMERLRSTRADISQVDSVQRFTDLGVDVFLGRGSFADDKTVMVENSRGETSKLEFKKAVIATGARAAAPPIKGLDTVNFLTNESLFSLTELPKRLGVIGGGPIGCEMAQSFARFGSEVFLFERSDQILGREDADAAAIVQAQFVKEGIHLLTGAEDMEVANEGDGQIKVQVKIDGGKKEVVVDQLLVAVGRAPNTDGLNLESVNVEVNKSGVVVNDFQQTTNPRIYAAGDICSPFKFTHAADFQARIVIQNALFALGPIGRKKTSKLVIPWATYTSPEIAHVGVYPEDAKKAGIEIDSWFQPLEDVDRAILDGKTEGFVKVHTKKGTDKIVGATIVAQHAGDLISQLTLAIKSGIGLSTISDTIHPYPTQADAIRKVAAQYTKTRLTPTSQKILNVLRRLNVGG